MWLELTWSIIPLVILMVMFTWGAKVYIAAYRPPANAKEYFVTAKQWMWKFQHPEGQREINHLHVPMGRSSRGNIQRSTLNAQRSRMSVLTWTLSVSC